MIPSIAKLLKQSQLLLNKVAGDNALLEAELLLAEVLQKERSYFYAWPEKIILLSQYNRFQTLLKTRLTGKPLAYILMKKAFWDFELKVTPDVLIPRPETELLIELTLDLFNQKEVISAIDLGTGSGAISCALAKEYPHWDMIAIEQSLASLKVAKTNFKLLEVDHIQSLQGNWLTDFDPNIIKYPLKLIVSNPPYIEQNDIHLTLNGLEFEPQKALVSGVDGLDDIRLIIKQAGGLLEKGGWLLLEHGYQQGEAVRDIFACFGFGEVRTHLDMAGLERVTRGRLL